MNFDIDELTKKAKDGDGLSTFILGRCYYYGENGVQKDYSSAYNLFLLGTERNKDPRCMFGLAMCYQNGYATEDFIKDEDKARELFCWAYRDLRYLVDDRDKYATFMLGEYYNKGLGKEPEDLSLAKFLYEQSANMGHPEGCCLTGLFYQYGYANRKDIKKAIAYYEKGAELGSKNAKTQLKIINKMQELGMKL